MLFRKKSIDHKALDDLEKEVNAKARKNRIDSIKNKIAQISKRTRIVIFALGFAVIGVVLLMFTRAEAPYGSLPTATNEYVLRYEKPMTHAIPDNDFAKGSFPAMLLYGNGLMLCLDHTASMANSETSPLSYIKSRLLSSSEKSALYQKVRDLGFDRVRQRTIPTALTPSLSGSTPTVSLNSSNGVRTAGLYQKETNTEFAAILSYLNSECAKATTEYNPDDVVVESIKYDRVPTNGMNPVPNANIPSDGAIHELKSKRLTGRDAKKLKTQVPKGNNFYKTSDGKVLKVRRMPKMPEYKSARPVLAQSKPGVAYAATDNSLRFLYVVAADQATPADSSALINDLASTMPVYYQGQVGKATTVAEVAVVRGAKTVAQYMTCSADVICDPAYPQSQASVYNLMNEFKRDGTNTVVLYSWVGDGACIGFGGGPNYGGIENVTRRPFGIAALSAVKCSTYGYGRVHRVGAHEAGHGFGLDHTCDTTLMTGCPYSGSLDDYRPLNVDQAAILRDFSPYFNYNPPPCPTGTSGTYPNCVTNTPPPPAATYFPLSPVRLMDTRAGQTTVDGQYAAIGIRGAGVVTALTVVGRAGVPSGATAVSLNVTVINPQAAGFVTVYPCGSPLPNTSNVNYLAAGLAANAVIAKVGTNGQVCVYTLAATDIIVDISGAFNN